jgi:hypothetical protein
MLLSSFLAQLNREYHSARLRFQGGQTYRDLLQMADDLAAAQCKKIWLGVEGWYADFPENEKQ